MLGMGQTLRRSPSAKASNSRPYSSSSALREPANGIQ